MPGKKSPRPKVRLFPPPPKGFDMVAASKRDLIRHGIPLRPDPRTQPGGAALWERLARRYQNFEHLQPELIAPDKPPKVKSAEELFGLFPRENCGFELFNNGPITMFSGTFTVPNLNNVPNQGQPNAFRIFFGLGFLDVHVEMTVDINHNVTSVIRIFGGGQVNLPVRPGDTINATLCLQINTAGTAYYGLTNETTGQRVNITFDTNFPPAVTINAGVSRGSQFGGGILDPLALFGVVYFDELAAYTPNGNRSLLDGVATSMTESNGTVLATPQRISDLAFKVVRS